MPEWERKTAKGAKDGRPLKRRRWASKDSRAWAREKLTSPSENTWATCILEKLNIKKGLEDPLLDK